MHVFSKELVTQILSSSLKRNFFKGYASFSNHSFWRKLKNFKKSAEIWKRGKICKKSAEFYRQTQNVHENGKQFARTLASPQKETLGQGLQSYPFLSKNIKSEEAAKFRLSSKGFCLYTFSAHLPTLNTKEI